MSEGFWLNAALVAAGVAGAAGFAWTIRGRENAGFARWFLLASGICLAAGIFVRWRAGGHAPLSNQYESLVFTALAAAVGAFLVRKPRSWMMALAGLAVAILLGLAALNHAPVAPLVPALRSNWLFIHVAVCMAAYAAFLLSAIASGWFLSRNRLSSPSAAANSRLADRRFSPSAAANSRLADRRFSPPARELDGFSYRLVQTGFVLLAVGIITGAVWANSAWGTWWSWDPKETWSLITWVFYALALHLRRTRGWRDEKFAWLSILGIASVAFTYFGVNFLLSGLHSYARG